MLVEKNVKDFVSLVSSKEPAPGGGSVSALAGSLGAALTSMVGNLTVGKKAYDKLEEEQKKAIDNNLVELHKYIDRLNNLIDEDTKSFNKVMGAYKLPKKTQEEKQLRSEQIQKATKYALEVPLDCALQCLFVMRLQKIFALYGNKNAITDVGVGSLLAYSGLEGALFNVRINLGSIKDEKYVEGIKKEIDKILKEGKDLKEEVLRIVYDELK